MKKTFYRYFLPICRVFLLKLSIFVEQMSYGNSVNIEIRVNHVLTPSVHQDGISNEVIGGLLWNERQTHQYSKFPFNKYI